MPQTQRAQSGKSASAALSIGQVLQRLTPEFPDVTPSKLRFLEDKGLVHPARTAAGYRKFTHGDLERLRTILTMQRDLYLPLKVIGEYLDAVDRGLNPELPGSRAPRTASILPSGTTLDRAELLRRAGASAKQLDQAISAGLLSASGSYGEDDLTLLRALTELEQHGIEARHLRPFRAAAQHELGLIEQALTASRRRNDPAGSVRAHEQADEIADHLETVRRTLVRHALRESRTRGR